jgi:hypothetical protein
MPEWVGSALGIAFWISGLTVVVMGFDPRLQRFGMPLVPFLGRKSKLILFALGFVVWCLVPVVWSVYIIIERTGWTIASMFVLWFVTVFFVTVSSLAIRAWRISRQHDGPETIT